MDAQDSAIAEFFDEKPISVKAAKRGQKKARSEAKQARRNPKPLEPRSERQEKYKESIETNSLTIAVGPPGVGKTYVAGRVFGEWLVAGKIKKLYLARPNVAKTKHRNGFLPGTLEDKTAPWLVPIFDGLKDSMAPSEFERMKREKVFEEVPYEFIQGRTFKDAGCIVDEVENLDLDDLYITLTRQGEGLSMVMCGDVDQARIPNTGLGAVVEMADYEFMEDNGIIEFTDEDVVRSKQAAQWVKAFRKYKREPQENRGFGHHSPGFME